MLTPVENHDPLKAVALKLQALPKGGLSRLAETTGIDISRLSGYRSGRKADLQISTLVKIAKALPI